ncbi:hypothetical protein H8S90_18260 [Olivibacter sp. SDN3]|uniref:hypothetical protein n=1 Tax=Olivibacter sp. SDN3 TaxID=2764720 RepID=UPI001650E983|nr:hypothetical protein [Olivibacter sp. SDN3]QNL48711.1 hypothetical protein H8S90_18260 [Olivibacter sp. SDN3]
MKLIIDCAGKVLYSDDRNYFAVESLNDSDKGLLHLQYKRRFTLTFVITDGKDAYILRNFGVRNNVF